jgi:hypothetical protein
MIEYQNRFGDTYFLQAGKTKTGKPKYYFGKKVTAEPIQAIPDGYEIRENPESGQVTLRKIRPTEIGLLEKQMLSDGVRAYAKLKHFIIDVDGNSLVVYIPGTREQDALELTQKISGMTGGISAFVSTFAEEIVTRSRYAPMMRFTLWDCDARLFDLERWCFLGSIDGWMHLAGAAPLPSLIEKYVRHLGKESFYKLF